MKLFYSKILLFGEYGIIKNSKGLAIPYNFYKGTLKTLEECEPNGQKREDAHKSNEALRAFASHLETLTNEANPIVRFNIEKLNADIADGMYFDSSIPQGYGVGSSGALVAAIYSEYAIDPINAMENLTREQLLRLKAIFGRMESFFHGTSSGLDPLNSYLSLPILINSHDNIEPTGIPTQTPDGKGAVFLLDSGIIGETAPMVRIFMENMKNEAFQKMLKEEFIKYTDACIDDFLKGRFKSLFGNIKSLSSIVLNHFKPMIPQEFHTLWKQGIDTGDYFLKLCGSGGGGYILGFTEDLEKAKRTLGNHKMEVVYQF
ncbi:MAG: mevalonate kinase family protein [Capnocytophaga sp.]|uniref:mevalonate kinase family protein n=1 Tax=Capnocytophaga sp. TaxID=44737 RepID=UPI003FA017D0